MDILYILMKTLLRSKIEAVVIYGICTRDRPEGVQELSRCDLDGHPYKAPV